MDWWGIILMGFVVQLVLGWFISRKNSMQFPLPAAFLGAFFWWNYGLEVALCGFLLGMIGFALYAAFIKWALQYSRGY